MNNFLSNIPHYYDRSLIVPLTLSQRKRNSHASSVQLPPIKLRSTLTWHSSEEENFLTYSRTSSDQELVIFKKKYDRLRATLSVRFFIFFISMIFFYAHISIRNRLFSQRYVLLDCLPALIFLLRK